MDDTSATESLLEVRITCVPRGVVILDEGTQDCESLADGKAGLGSGGALSVITQWVTLSYISTRSPKVPA